MGRQLTSPENDLSSPQSRGCTLPLFLERRLTLYLYPSRDFLFFLYFLYFQTWTEYLSITASKFPFLKKPSPLINLPNPIEAR